MAQETFYFPHDYEPLSDIKMGQFVRKHGAVGYGFFWRVIEMLHQDEYHRLPFKQYVYDEIADRLLITPELVETLLEECVGKYDLLCADGIEFWSERVFRNIKKRQEIVANKSKAGKASAEARKRMKELLDANPELLEDFNTCSTPVDTCSTPVNKERKKEIISY